MTQTHEKPVVTLTDADANERIDVQGLNGKTGELLRWILTAVLSVVIAYFTAMNSVENRLTAVEVRQDTQYQQVLRELSEIKSDIRDIRQSFAGRAK